MTYDRLRSIVEFHAPHRGRPMAGGRRRRPSVAVRTVSSDVAQDQPARGFTLIEVTLVLVILVVVGAFMYPQMMGAYNRSQLRSGGEVIRTAWLRTRLSAMETGQAHVFRCLLNGGEFQVFSISELMSGGDQPENPAGIVYEDTGQWNLEFTHLPPGITFGKVDVAPSQLVAAVLTGLQNQAWAGPVIFYPDGTCTDATLLVINENQNTVRVTLRGITGTVTLGEVGKEAL